MLTCKDTTEINGTLLVILYFGLDIAKKSRKQRHHHHHKHAVDSDHTKHSHSEASSTKGRWFCIYITSCISEYLLGALE